MRDEYPSSITEPEFTKEMHLTKKESASAAESSQLSLIAPCLEWPKFCANSNRGS